MKTLLLIGLVWVACNSAFATVNSLGEEIPQFEEAFNNANIIIEGELVDIQANWVSGGYKLVFEVNQSWKRSTEKYTTLNLPKGETCLEMYNLGNTYLVYVEKKFNLKVFCSSRAFAAESNEVKSDLELLKTGLPASQSPGAQYLPIVMTFLVLGGLGLLAMVVLRKGKKS